MSVVHDQLAKIHDILDKFFFLNDLVSRSYFFTSLFKYFQVLSLCLAFTRPVS